MEGWIKIYRSSLDHWIYNEYRPITRREAWENLILWANYSDSNVLIKGQLIECKRGQLLFSLETYAQKFVWSISQVRTFFELLKKDGMIKLEGLKYTTRLTICNYEKYQGDQQAENKLNANSTQTDCILTTNSSQQNKNIKKVNKNNKVNKISNSKKRERFLPPTLQDVISFFITEKGLSQIDSEYRSERFIEFYESKGWAVGKSKMVNWKAAASNSLKWEDKRPKQLNNRYIEHNQVVKNSPTYTKNGANKVGSDY